MILVASMGTGPYGETEYYRQDDGRKRCRTCFAPVATARLYGASEALLLLTPEAENEHGRKLRQELAANGVSARPVPIPLGRSEGEIWEIVDAILKSVPQRAEVVADVTHALRHLPILMLSALTFLAVRKGVTVRAILYGAKEAGKEGMTPLFDLGPFLTLMDGFHAARQFQEAGDGRRVGDELARLNSAHFQKGMGDPEFSKVASKLADMSEALLSGLPLETGIFSRQAADHLEAARRGPGMSRPVIRSLLDMVGETVQAFASSAEARSKKGIWLDAEELKRQMRIVKFHLERKNTSLALLLLREWIISRCALAGGRGNWLDYGGCRLAIERALNGLVERNRANRDSVTAAQRELCSVWDSTAARRNALAHAGMRPERVPLETEAVAVGGLVEWCELHTEDDAAWQLGPALEGGGLLITALGLSPGVLLTALGSPWLDANSRVLVVTSEQASRSIPQVCQRAGWSPSRIRTEIVRDAHRCFTEAAGIAGRLRGAIAGCSAVTLNVTGGTTALQYVVERLGREAERLGIGVRRIALIDDRPLEEQQREPYVAGQVFELESGGGIAAGT